MFVCKSVRLIKKIKKIKKIFFFMRKKKTLNLFYIRFLINLKKKLKQFTLEYIIFSFLIFKLCTYIITLLFNIILLFSLIITLFKFMIYRIN